MLDPMMLTRLRRVAKSLDLKVEASPFSAVGRVGLERHSTSFVDTSEKQEGRRGAQFIREIQIGDETFKRSEGLRGFGSKFNSGFIYESDRLSIAIDGTQSYKDGDKLKFYLSGELLHDVLMGSVSNYPVLKFEADPADVPMLPSKIAKIKMLLREYDKKVRQARSGSFKFGPYVLDQKVGKPNQLVRSAGSPYFQLNGGSYQNSATRWYQIKLIGAGKKISNNFNLDGSKSPQATLDKIWAKYGDRYEAILSTSSAELSYYFGNEPPTKAKLQDVEKFKEELNQLVRKYQLKAN